MGNSLCTVDKCGESYSTPSGYLEYHDRKKQRAALLTEENQRMDIMGSAYYQAMYDFKYYFGNKLNTIGDDGQNQDEDREMQKLRNYYINQMRKDSDDSKSSTIKRRKEDLYNVS